MARTTHRSIMTEMGMSMGTTSSIGKATGDTRSRSTKDTTETSTPSPEEDSTKKQGSTTSGMRYYGAELGRFLTRDPIGYFAHALSLYEYTHGAPTIQTDPSGLLAVCCRRMRTGGKGDCIIDHCQLRNRCVSGEESSPVWPDRDPNRKMDNGKHCSQASKADIEACLRRNAHSDKPRGGEASIGNNCQTGTLLRLGKCCLSSTWKPGLVAGNHRGRCVKWRRFFIAGRFYQYCEHWEVPNWQRKCPKPCPDPPVCPPIDDYSHGGWPIDDLPPPGTVYPPGDTMPIAPNQTE